MKRVIIILIAIIVVVGGIYFVMSNNSKQQQQNNNNSISNENNSVATTKYQLQYEGKNMTPNAVFSKDNFGQETNYSEIPSCAFDGVDKVYTYNDYEITTTMLNGQEVIYSTYLLNDAVSTPEGVKVSDSVSTMLQAYGENYEQNGTEYIYKDNKVSISFITENDVIISIQYTMIVEY